MGKCYFTELPAVVNDSSLRVYGRAEIKAKSATKVAAWIESSDEQTVRLYDPSGNLISETDLVPGSRETVGVADMSTYEYVTYVFEDFYNLVSFYGHINGSFGGAADSKYYIKLSEWSYSNIETIQNSADGSLVYEVDNYKKPIYLPNMDKPIFFSNNVDNIGFLAGCTKTAQIQSGTSLSMQIHGEWTEVLAAMCANGRATGSMNVDMYSNGHLATFNGIMTGPVAFTVTFNNSGCVVTDRIQFTEKTGYTSATYNKATGEWTFETA